MDETLKRILELMGNGHGSRTELADYLGIHPNVITNWKNGRNHSYNKHLTQIAKYFDVTVDYLLGNTDTKKGSDESSEPQDVSVLMTQLENALNGSSVLFDGMSITDEDKLRVYNGIMFLKSELAANAKKHQKDGK